LDKDIGINGSASRFNLRSGLCPHARHVEECFALIFSLGLVSPIKTLSGVLAIFVC
jgi:hypothetical protein